MPHQPHEPGSCFCRDCGTRARLNAPTLYGFLGKEPGGTFIQVHAWCPHCANWHRHGDHTNQAGDVLHRYVHCIRGDGPYKATGYLIAVTNIPLASVRPLMRRTSAAQRRALGEGRTTVAIERLRAQVLPLLQPRHHGGRS